MIEAMACGTPVIAFSQGSVPEIIEPGITGFVATDVDEAVRAVAELPRLSRRRCRQRFEERFTATKMAKEYLALYEHLLGAQPHSDASTLRFEQPLSNHERHH